MDPRHREAIVRDLESPDEEVRRQAVARLHALPADQAVPRLAQRLGDTSWRVRKAAVEALGCCPDPARAAALLIEGLGDGDNPGRRNAALEALVRCGQPAVPALIESLADPDVDVRKQVVDALAGIADPGSAEAVARVLADEDANVRAAAADALGAIGWPQSAVALQESLQLDPERLVRLSALRALARLQCTVPLASLEAALDDSLLRPAALALLGHSDEVAASEVLLKSLGADSASCRQAAIEALLRVLSRADAEEMERLAERARAVASATPELLADAASRLTTAALSVRMTLIQFLGMLQGEEVVVPLLRAGRDPELADLVVGTLLSFGRGVDGWLVARWEGLEAQDRVRACAVLAAGRGQAGEARLVACLGDSDPGVRRAAEAALGTRGGAFALGELLRLFEAAALATALDPEEADRLADAIANLAGRAENTGDAVAARIEALIAGAEETFRCAAARALGGIPGTESARALRLLLADPDESVRRASVEALARCADAELRESLHLALADDAPSVRIAAAAALSGAPDPQSLDDLGQLCVDDDPRVRAAAMRAIGAIESEPGQRLALLERGVFDGGPVALAALEGLRALGDPRGAGVAARLLDAEAPELVKAAVACIGGCAELPRLEQLVPLIAHSHWTVRAEVARVLGEREAGHARAALAEQLRTEPDDFVREVIHVALEQLEP
jgi:HEAT repeat protein